MHLSQAVRMLNEKAHIYDDHDLAYMAQELEKYTISRSVDAARLPDKAVMLSVPAAAAALSLSVDYVWKLVASGKLKTVKHGRRRLVRKSDLIAFTDNFTDGMA